MIRISFQTIIIIILSFIGPAINAKSIPYLRPGNNIHLNLFGDASIFSISYERIILNNPKFFLTGKLGLGYSESMKLPSGNTSLLSIPIHITGNVDIYGKRQFIEFGFGSTWLFYEDLKYWDYSIYPLIGYRFQPFKPGKVTFRIFISYPITGKIDINDYWFSPVGLSIGYSF
jgi:hypothetical protein